MERALTQLIQVNLCLTKRAPSIKLKKHIGMCYKNFVRFATTSLEDKIFEHLQLNYCNAC